MMNKSQADIAYGFTSITRRDPAYYAFWLMNNAFGQYAIGGRLGDSIRERQGMAYYVSSALDANVVEGPLAIRAGVSPANVDRAVASIDEEIARLLQRGPDAAGTGRVAPLSHRLDPARARDERRRSRTSCRSRSFSASGSTTTCACPTCSTPSRSTMRMRLRAACSIRPVRRS